MPDALGPPGCPYDPGNAGVARSIAVQTVTLHRTIGSWGGDYSVGKNRSHNDGTFQWLIGQEPGQWVQFYPCDTFASHAAGSNEVGPGIEISGQNGEPLTDWQIEALGKILRWLRDEWAIAPSFTEGDPRTWYDQAGPSGFVCHNSVAYPPRPSLQHYDYITEDEFNRAIGVPAPAPPPPAVKETMPVPFKMHSPTRAAVVTEDEVYVVGYGGTMAFVEVDDATFDFIVADVRAKRLEGRKVRQVRG